MNNKEWLSETISDMYERQNTIHIGQTVKIGDKEEVENAREGKNRRRAGTIIGLYEHFMLVKFENGRESFNYIDIITSITNYDDTNNRGGERLFSAKFGKEYKRLTIEMIPFEVKLENKDLKYKKDRKIMKTIENKNEKKQKKEKIYRNWTIEQVNYIMSKKDNGARQELADDFNLKFGRNVTREQINAVIQREKAKI